MVCNEVGNVGYNRKDISLARNVGCNIIKHNKKDTPKSNFLSQV